MFTFNTSEEIYNNLSNTREFYKYNGRHWLSEIKHEVNHHYKVGEIFFFYMQEKFLYCEC